MSFKKYIVHDLAHDENGQVIIENGDLVVRPSDEAHQLDLVVSAKGSWRFNPTVGVDIHKFLNSSAVVDEIYQNIQEQMTIDGYSVKEINLTTDGQLSIDAKRIK